jgi:ubiquinone/menaquinone biosynthesis C-methylase UbiE
MNKYGGYQDLPILAELYDLTPGYTNRTDRDFYLNYCKESRGRILELGCGTGRILIPAAEAGCRITGLDSSEHMLAECREKLKEQPREVRDRTRLVHGDMCDFNLEDEFHLAIIPFRPFQHLIALEDQMACLKNISRHLVRGGRLVFDVFQVNLEYITNPKSAEEAEDMPEFKLPDGRLFRRTHRIAGTHRTEQYNDVELIFYVTDLNGKTQRIVQAFPFRYFFRYEMEHLLARCGFEPLDLFGDFDRSPLTDESPEMIFVVEKRR